MLAQLPWNRYIFIRLKQLWLYINVSEDIWDGSMLKPPITTWLLLSLYASVAEAFFEVFPEAFLEALPILPANGYFWSVRKTRIQIELVAI